MRRLQSVSKFGLLVAALMICGGVMLIARSVDMVVDHQRNWKGTPPGRRIEAIEHVTRGRSQFYGGALAIAGIALGIFSLYTPRK